MADPVAVTALPIKAFSRISPGDDFGPLQFRGGLSLKSTEKNFGGLSGLVMTKDCNGFIAISDAGRWFTATLSYDNDRLSGISGGELAPMLDAKGKPPRSKHYGDAEAVTRLANGTLGVGFESDVRFGSYDIAKDGFKARFKRIPHPYGIDEGPANGQVEAFGQLPSGAYIAISEKQRDAKGNIRAWIWKGSKTTPFSIQRSGDFDITDLAVLPDGDILTLERSFARGSLPGMAIRRFAAKGLKTNATVTPKTLIETNVALSVIDNMEGIGLCKRGDETRVTLVSDDNFDRVLQSTILLQFALKP
jgi:hypothetical protein